MLDSQNPLERVMPTQNGRLLFCGKILIQLNKNLDDIQDIGAYVLEKENAFNTYQFYSLLNKNERKQIVHHLKIKGCFLTF